MKCSVIVIENDQFGVQFIRLIRSIATILMSGNVRIIESSIDHTFAALGIFVSLLYPPAELSID